jgi:DNA modification methylase
MSNKRDVWTLPIGHYKGEHFATFPPALITPCIRAGSRSGDIIFDPSAGSGTIGAVAQEYNRELC